MGNNDFGQSTQQLALMNSELEDTTTARPGDTVQSSAPAVQRGDTVRSSAHGKN